MIELLSSGTERPRVTTIAGRSTLVVYGKALVITLGRPSECNRFDDLGEEFVIAVLVSGKDFDRIDTMFDRYREIPIKCAIRKKRSRGHAPFRRVIEDGSVPLPNSWSNFLVPDEKQGRSSTLPLRKANCRSPSQ